MKSHEKWNIGLTIVGIAVSAIGLGLIFLQVLQVNEHKRWENYNSMNLRYYEWYDKKPTELAADACNMLAIDEVRKRTRMYFDLYGEEYWLFLNDLIPEEMWTKRIDRGVEINLVQYPALVRGYEYWKRQGAFTHPEGFIKLVDDKIKALKDSGRLKLADCRVGNGSKKRK